MSFKRDGDDYATLNHVRKQRVEELLSKDIPEDQACLLKNGRFACLVCSTRPVLDTIDMLCIHRNGKKHKTCAEHFFRKKREFHQLVEKRRQQASLQGNHAIETQKAPLLLETKKATRNALLRYAPYNPISSGAQSGQNHREDFKTNRSESKGFFQYTHNFLLNNVPRKSKVAYSLPSTGISTDSHRNVSEKELLSKGGPCSVEPAGDSHILSDDPILKPPLSDESKLSPTVKHRGRLPSSYGSQKMVANVVLKPYISKRQKFTTKVSHNPNRSVSIIGESDGDSDCEPISEFPPREEVRYRGRLKNGSPIEEDCLGVNMEKEKGLLHGRTKFAETEGVPASAGEVPRELKGQSFLRQTENRLEKVQTMICQVHSGGDRHATSVQEYSTYKQPCNDIGQEKSRCNKNKALSGDVWQLETGFHSNARVSDGYLPYKDAYWEGFAGNESGNIQNQLKPVQTGPPGTFNENFHCKIDRRTKENAAVLVCHNAGQLEHRLEQAKTELDESSKNTAIYHKYSERKCRDSTHSEGDVKQDSIVPGVGTANIRDTSVKFTFGGGTTPKIAEAGKAVPGMGVDDRVKGKNAPHTQRTMAGITKEANEETSRRKNKRGRPTMEKKTTTTSSYSEERKRELQRHLELTSSGWVHDPSGKWVKDEDVEFDSDEEEPN